MVINIVSGISQSSTRTGNAVSSDSGEQVTPVLTSSSETQQSESAAANSAAPDNEATELATAVSKLNDYVQNIQRTLSFSVEENTGATVVQVYDSETEELIRQIPAEETLKLAASIEAFTASLFVKEQA